MKQDIKKFTINSKILNKSYKESFILRDDGKIFLSKKSNRGFFITPKLDSSQKGMKWGRLVVNSCLPEGCEIYIYAMASDELQFNYKNQLINFENFFKSKDILLEEKLFVLSNIGAKVEKNKKDILLHGLEGRYLWVGIEIKYNSCDLYIEGISVYFPYDSLIKYFPEIYKKNKDSFFERYLSIFSSMNKDYQQEVKNVASLIDIDKAPDKMLPLLSCWLGIDTKGKFLNNNQQRILIKNARYLNQYKGTVNVISKVIEMFIGVKPIIVEQAKVKKYIPLEYNILYRKLYGTNPFEFIVMINKDLTEEVFYQLKSLINMFKPIRTKAKIIFLNQEYQIDRYCYLGINSRLTKNPEGVLSKNQHIDTNVIVARG